MDHGVSELKDTRPAKGARSFTSDADFSFYRKELRDLIKNPDYGILLNADDWWREQQARIRVRKLAHNDGDSTPEVLEDAHSEIDSAAFRLATSTRFQKEFVSLWELFDHTNEYKVCSTALADLAKSIRQVNPFSAIVTCTATAKHLLERIHSLVETEREPVQVHYLHAYPFVSPDGRSTLNFRGQRVLLLTDVVASGSLVEELARTVTELGGTVIGALCVVLVGESKIAELASSNEPPRLKLSEGQEIYLYSLTDYIIPELKPHQFNQAYEIKINPYTVFPYDIEIHPSNTGGRFSLTEFFEHTEQSNALTFDFYEWDNSRFTSAVNLDRLFGKFGGAIWEKVSEAIFVPEPSSTKRPPKASGKSQLNILTTFNATDLEFKEFVAERLAGDSTTACDTRFAYLQRQEVIRDRDAFLVFPRKSYAEIDGKSVTVLLSSIQSSQTLRDLASFLATANVTEINIVCLINRMGRRTNAFINRVRDLLKGLGRNSNEPTRFNFTSIYAVCDFDTADIKQIQDTAKTLLDHYVTSTTVPSFVNCTERFRKYFMSHQITGQIARIDDRGQLKTPLDVSWSDTSLKITSRAGRLVWMVAKFISDRKFDTISRALVESDDRLEILKLCALLLHDVGHLRWSGESTALQDSLLNRVQTLRQERFEIEQDIVELRLSPDGLRGEIDRRLEIEQHLLFTLAMLSYLGNSRNGHLLLLEEVVTCKLDPEKWKSSYPRNFLRHFGDDQSMWVVSLMLRMSFQDEQNNDGLKSVRERLTNVIQTFLASIDGQEAVDEFLRNVEGDELDLVKTQLRSVKDNLHMFLQDLGYYSVQHRNHIVRLLRSHVLTPEQHSPIATNLNSAIRNLSRAVLHTESVALVVNGANKILETIDEQAFRRMRFEDSASQIAVNDAIHAVSMLQTVAEAAEEFFHFTSCKRDEISRYLSPIGSENFRTCLCNLESLFQSIRRTNTVSAFELNQLQKLTREVHRDIWDPSSILRRELGRLEVPLKEWILKSLKSATKSFTDKGRTFSGTWQGVIRQLEARKDIDSAKVLIDPFLLQESMRNIFTNARHSLGHVQDEVNWEDHVELDIAPDKSPVEAWVVTVKTFGSPFDEAKMQQPEWRSKTFFYHAAEIEKFGGRMSIHPFNANDRVGCHVSITIPST